MFTSKKALYLNKNFDRISPITNIDSLYYERAEKLDDSSYKIHRMSVAKHMPIKFKCDISILNLSIVDSSNPIAGEVSLGPITKNVSVNINYTKIDVPNIENQLTHNLTYETSLYHIDSSIEINLLDYLQYYLPVDYFDTSINNIVNQINTINSNISNISNYIVDTSLAADQLINALTTHTANYKWNDLDTSTLVENNGIYNLVYYPYESHHEQYIKNASFVIKVLCISTNFIKDYISLGVAQKTDYIEELHVDKWDFHYDFDSNAITYLKDEYGNEGNFDFRIHRLKNVNRNIFYSNITDANNCKNNIIYLSPEQLDNLYIAISCSSAYNNLIYNSNEISIESDLQYSPANNIINNSYELTIRNNSQNNKIFNSSNYDCDVSGNNNTIINCNDCSIYITGNNNVLINLKNLTLSLGDNNTIICDEAGCPNNLKTLNNDRLFLNYSSSTALALDLSTNCTIFGGIDNDVSVYGSFATTNK